MADVFGSSPLLLVDEPTESWRERSLTPTKGNAVVAISNDSISRLKILELTIEPFWMILSRNRLHEAGRFLNT